MAADGDPSPEICGAGHARAQGGSRGVARGSGPTPRIDWRSRRCAREPRGRIARRVAPRVEARVEARVRPESRAADPAARLFLEKAAKAHAPDGEPKIRDVTIEFEAESNFEGQHLDVSEATHRFLRPDHIRTQLKSRAGAVDRGFDGKSYWLKRGDKTLLLEGRETEKDRNEIDYTVRFTEHLLQMVALETLADRLANLGLLPSGSAACAGGLPTIRRCARGCARPTWSSASTRRTSTSSR